MGEFGYQEELQALYPLISPDAGLSCFDYRKKTNKRMVFLLLHALEHNKLSSGFEKLYHHFSQSEHRNLIIPYPNLLTEIGVENGWVFDGIGVTGRLHNKNFMLMGIESPESSNDEGTGKSSIVYQTTGIQVPYDEVRASIDNLLEGDEFAEIGSWDITSINGGKFVASNTSYFGIKEGKLALAPSSGEVLWAKWDLARHLYRVLNLKKDFGPQSEENAKIILLSIAASLCFDPNIFVSNQEVHILDYVMKISRKEGVNKLKFEESDPRETLKYLFQENPKYNLSRFWSINVAEQQRRALLLLSMISNGNLPRTFEIIIGKDAGKNELAEVVGKLEEEIK